MESRKLGVDESQLKSTGASCPVTISSAASVEIKKIMATKNIPVGYGLRVGVRGGGCGVQLILGFDKEKDGDLVYEQMGVTVIMDKKHMLYLIGKQVDFYEGTDVRGFHFNEASGTPANKNLDTK
jgi:iron-sulfur cluster assembly protein